MIKKFGPPNIKDTSEEISSFHEKRANLAKLASEIYVKNFLQHEKMYIEKHGPQVFNNFVMRMQTKDFNAETGQITIDSWLEPRIFTEHEKIDMNTAPVDTPTKPRRI